MGKLAKVILKSSSSSPFNGYSNTYSERMHFFELFAIFNVFYNLYVLYFFRPARNKDFKNKANLRQHINKNIIYIANAQQSYSSVQIECKIS
jgi:hypothetical protein